MLRARLSWLAVGLVILTVALAGCAEEVQPGEEEEAPEPVLDAQAALAERLGVPEEEIDIVSFQQVDWQDACLELAEEDEACAQVVTPGWRVTMEVNGETFDAHTDETGDTIRFVQAASG